MTQEILVQVAEIVASLVAVGGGTVAVTQFIKTKLGLEGKSALTLFWVIALVFAVGQMLIAGQLAPEALTLDKLSETLPLIVLGAQAIYKQFVAEA